MTYVVAHRRLSRSSDASSTAPILERHDDQIEAIVAQAADRLVDRAARCALAEAEALQDGRDVAPAPVRQIPTRLCASMILPDATGPASARAVLRPTATTPGGATRFDRVARRQRRVRHDGSIPAIADCCGSIEHRRHHDQQLGLVALPPRAREQLPENRDVHQQRNAGLASSVARSSNMPEMIRLSFAPHVHRGLEPRVVSAGMRNPEIVMALLKSSADTSGSTLSLTRLSLMISPMKRSRMPNSLY